MALHLKDVRIDNCGTGIRAPKDANIRADGLEITNTGTAIDLRDPPGLLQRLGLPSETPPPYLLEALRILEGARHLPESERIQSLRESQLIRWLGVSADLLGIGAALVTAQAQGLTSQIVERLFG